MSNAILGFKPGEEAPLVPLSLSMECCETEENLERNISATLSRPYVRFNEYIDSQKGRVNLCGFGPSLTSTYQTMVGDVMACNGAHDWLIEKGVIPKWCLLMDAAPEMTKLVTPHPDVTYMVASRCHQNLFDHLKGFKVIVWHCAGDLKAMDLLEAKGLMEPLVNGGTATVTRGMVLAVAMGYEELHLYGADSSYEGDFTHVKKSIVEEKELMVFVNHKWFKTTPWMCGQVEDIKVLCPPLIEGGARFVFYGDGLLPFVARTLGYEVHQPLDEE